MVCGAHTWWLGHCREMRRGGLWSRLCGTRDSWDGTVWDGTQMPQQEPVIDRALEENPLSSWPLPQNANNQTGMLHCCLAQMLPLRRNMYAQLHVWQRRSGQGSRMSCLAGYHHHLHCHNGAPYDVAGSDGPNGSRSSCKLLAAHYCRGQKNQGRRRWLLLQGRLPQ